MVDSPSVLPQPPGGDAAPAAAPVMSSAESRTSVLYRAALGPVQTERYLAVFARFDKAGHRPLVWHPAAALFTMNWLVFRRLWGAALAYALVLLGVLGLAGWWWPEVSTWPDGIRWGLGASLLLLAVVGPGLAGYALVHRQVQRRLLKAVAASSTMAEARTALARQASTRQRLWALLGINGLILMGVLLQVEPLVAGLTRLEAALRPQVAEPVVQPLGATKGATTVAASGVSGPAVAPVVAPVVQPPVVQSDPPAPAAPAVARPVSPDAPVAEPAPAVAGSAVPLPPPGSGAARAPVLRYGINVGLFADAGNGRRAHDRLRQAGLPATLEDISTVRGPRTRVRVGPFQREDEAEAAALRVRALGLEAVVYPR